VIGTTPPIDAPVPLPRVANVAPMRTRKVSLVSWNITGLGLGKDITPSNLATKDLHSFLSRFDMIFLTETWLMPEDDIVIEGYDVKAFCRPSRDGRSRHGGVLMAMRYDLGAKVEILAQKDDLFVLAGITMEGNDLVVGLVYNPPEASPYRCDTLFEELGNAIAYHGNGKPIILLGDLNARIQDRQSDIFRLSHPRTSSDATPNRDGHELMELVNNTKLCILNGAVGDVALTGGPTFQTAGGSSVVDYVAVSDDMLPKCSMYISPMRVESHHFPLVVELLQAVGERAPSHTTELGISRKLVMSQDDLERLSHKLATEETQSVLDCFSASLIGTDMTVDAMAENFEVLVYELASDVGRVSKTRKGGQSFPCNEWYDEDCKAAKRAAHDASRRGDWVAYRQLKQEFDRVTQLKKREYHGVMSDKLQNLYGNDRAEMWNTLSRFSKKQTTCPIELDVFLKDLEAQNEEPADPTDDAGEMDEFVRHYLEVPQCDEVVRDVLDKPIAQEEITQACSQLKAGTSCGADGIPLSVIQCFASITSLLTLMFNIILMKGEYPARWIEGMISPILKPGKDAKCTSSYRKVTVMAHIGKLFEKVIENRLAKFESLLGSEDRMNNGFSRGFRPADNLVIIDCLIRRYRFIRKPLFVAFIDFTQAFDLVNRSGLFYKMVLRGFGSPALKVIYSMYQKSRSAFRLNGRFTASIRTLLGVNQGSILSPRLFKKFFQDLGDSLDAPGAYLNELMIKYLLWADDLVLFATDAEALQRQLANLEAYCKKWKVKINPTKTKIMIFDNVRGRKSVRDSPVFVLDDTEVQVTCEAIYLGVAINSKFENHFKTHIDYVTKKAQKSLYRIYSLCKNVGALPPQLALHLFDTLIVSVLRYACEVWYNPMPSCSKPLEAMQLKFLRYILGVRRTTPIAALYGETGRRPLDLEFRYQAVTYAGKLFGRIDLAPGSPLFVAREYLSDSVLGNRPCWLRTISSISNEATVSQITERCINLPRWRTSQLAAFKDNWVLEMLQSSKLRTYVTFKSQLCIEPYLIHVRNARQRKALTRFRVSSHNLAIERLRWNSAHIPAEQRLCNVCGTVEDELHAFMLCSRYSEARSQLFARLITTGSQCLLPLSAGEVFTRLMTNDSVDGCRSIACFIHSVLTMHADVA
jgi:hypothetical protein